MLQNPGDDGRILDAGDDLDGAAATLTDGHSLPCRPVPRGLPASVKQLRTTRPFGLLRSWRTVICKTPTTPR
jgi:hypothetical protein